MREDLTEAEVNRFAGDWVSLRLFATISHLTERHQSAFAWLKNGGFKWSDVNNEGRFFSDNHGQQRKMDNYYDSVKILSIRNVQEYKPVALDLKKSEFTYELKKDIINQIQIDSIQYPVLIYLFEKSLHLLIRLLRSLIRLLLRLLLITFKHFIIFAEIKKYFFVFSYFLHHMRSRTAPSRTFAVSYKHENITIRYLIT